MPAERTAGAAVPSRRVVWLARAGGLLVRALGWTWRIRVTHDDAVRRARVERRPIIFTLWHGQLLPLLYQHRRENVTVLISEHGDGEIIARIATSLGYRTVRGSTSRGAARALIESARVIADSGDLAITPDGPRGPARSFAPGAAVLAQRTGALVIGAAASAHPAWRLKSWDRFMVPAPFARVRVAYSDAVTVVAADSRAALIEIERLEELMTIAEQRADG
ncbi:MAG TPA: lysophospholipid acyltransferase family protein [Gemmatimonadaceae bacterium]|nr:lysophospholipid acyltransferase family protein [Gemmatimonadaceae bacterium]